MEMAEVVAARLPWVSGDLREWYSPAALESQLAADLAGALALVGDREFAARFRRDAGLSVDVDELDWAHRVLALPGGGWALTGIRFRGRDVTKPFVDVAATSAGPTPAEVARVAALVATAYAAFEPRCVRFDVGDPDGLVAALADEPDGAGAEVDQYVVAGLVASLQQRATGPSYDRVTLRQGKPGPLAARAAAIYADLHAEAPSTVLWAGAEDVESLAECAAEDHLFEVLVDGEPAGVVAALREDAHGLLGYVVQELCLDARHRGRRWAAPVLQHLVQTLPAYDGTTLWGTIHPDNAASLRNATSVGRRTVGGFVWVTPAGLPGMSRAD